MTDRYVAGSDYREGSLEVRMPELESGLHRLRVEAWDTYNNWAEAELDFRIFDSDGVSDILFHPNPLANEWEGHFTFTLSQAAESVRVRVYTVTGRRIAEIRAPGSQGYNQIQWLPARGVANGTYLYEISAGAAPPHHGIIQIAR